MKTFDPPEKPGIVLSADRRHVLIAWNPKAGAGRGQKQIKIIQEHLADKGFSCFISTDLNEVSDLAHRWYEKGDLRAVLGSGGDGTVRELAQRSPVGAPIAVYPSGTANLLSKYLWQRRRVTAESVSQAIEVGHACQFDAGIANGQLFVLMCSCGLDAAVVRQLHDKRTGHIGYGSYLKPLFQTCREYDYPELLIYCLEASNADVQSTLPTLRTKWAFAFNFPCYAAGSGFAKTAEPTDGILDLCTFDGQGFCSGLSFYLQTVLGGRSIEKQQFLRASRLRITSEQPVPYQIDGDPGGNLPLEIETVSNRLTLIVPPV